VEVTALRVTAVRSVTKVAPQPGLATGSAELPARDVIFESGDSYSATVLDGPRLDPGWTFDGPAIVQEDTTHIVIPPKARATVLAGRHILIELGEGGWR
jgi:N-methylhydantoinase A